MTSRPTKTPITIAQGDGIGPEIMQATLRILEAAGAAIAPEFVVMGEKAFKQGAVNGISTEAWDSLKRTKVLLKAPLTTPQGGGYKSANVTLRKTFGLFANVRAVRTFEPYVPTKHAGVDMVIVRENEEDLYAGVEYQQTAHTCHSVKFLSQEGTETIIRYAFEFARAHKRKKVTCLVKDNIMKISDGLFHKIFDRVGQEYPELEKETLIVDIGMARVADTPENFDVIVTLNLYGDIVSDVASQVSGSVGLAGSMNMGRDFAMFEAVHGSAPDIAGKTLANPSGLLNAAVLMLTHIGQEDVALKVGNAWLAAIEAGHHTKDIAAKGTQALTTEEFADKVITFLGRKPHKLPAFERSQSFDVPVLADHQEEHSPQKRLVGVDVFVDWSGHNPQELGALVEQTQTGHLALSAIASRGLKMYPSQTEVRGVTDHWRCRFLAEDTTALTLRDVRALLAGFDTLNLQWTKIENLFTFDGERGFSALQGE